LYDTVSNNPVYDDKAKADTLNNFFCSIAKIDDDSGEILNADLLAIKQWSDKWKVTFNPNKTE